MIVCAKYSQFYMRLFDRSVDARDVCVCVCVCVCARARARTFACVRERERENMNMNTNMIEYGQRGPFKGVNKTETLKQK